MRHFFALLWSAALVLPISVHGAELNAGFVQGLWYGSEHQIAQVPTRIYVALRNNTETDLSGTVRFTDNGTRIGSTNVSALPGRIVEAWIDWTPTYGDHTIIATLSDVRVHEIGSTPAAGEVEEALAQDTIFVDYDTDRDSIPNALDTDDDGDSTSDLDEVTHGTDPLVATPPAVSPRTSPEEVTDATQSDTENETPSNDIPTLPATQNTTREGLEHYLGDGTLDTVVTKFSEAIEHTKSDLDTYRSARTDALKAYFKDSYETVEESSTTPGGVATITRTQIKRDTPFLESVLNGGKALVASLYTFILWLSSHALGHPALLELGLLLLILSVIYRTARRLGRRRTN